VLKELGLPSYLVPFVPFFGKKSRPCACNTCGIILVNSSENSLLRHLATLQHVTNMENALARPVFKPTPITDESRYRRLDWVVYVRLNLRNHFSPSHHLSSFLLPLTIPYSAFRMASLPTSLVSVMAHLKWTDWRVQYHALAPK
jgi:hypothetical protein